MEENKHSAQQQAPDAPEAEPTESTTELPLKLVRELEELRAALEDERAKAEEYLSRLQRLQADFTNYRKRTLSEQGEWASRAVGDFVKQLLPVVDNLERALDSGRGSENDDEEGIVQGVSMVLEQLHEVLKRADVVRIEARGEQFDPNFHEAVMQRDTSDYPDNEVVDVFQQGYRLGTRVLRPAMVVVARNKTSEPESSNKQPEELKEG